MEDATAALRLNGLRSIRGWFIAKSWMVRSALLAHFLVQPEGDFVNCPFHKWHHKSKCKDQQVAHYHQEAMQLADAFSVSVEKPEVSTVTDLIE